MATLSAFKQNAQAMRDGEWINPGPEYGDLEILTRGLTDAYFDAQAAALRRAARAYGGEEARIPAAIRRTININALIQHVLIDVKNLTDDAGEAVTIAAFRDMLRDPDYAPLAAVCFQAASLVGAVRAEELTDAAGNSAASSAGR